ncbi:MAG TPA: phosphate signaling complex protein PhoU [Rubricoccaceae bacterium]|nr:phosphate signaling complex protein PhoU [Rubricoccaceae bacterium]
MSAYRPLDEEIRLLWDLLVKMNLLVDEQLADAIDAVTTCDLEKAQRVRDRDDEVDKLELDVDHQCERILALHTPVAVDLRLILTAVKLNTDLERIGDHAKNLAKLTPRLEGCTGLVGETRILETADAARALLRDAQDAFIKRDRLLARRVIAHDRNVDALHRETVDRLLELVREDPEHAGPLVHLVVMSRAIERIADYAVNIAETVVFLIEGVDIRHRKLQRGPHQETPAEEA